MQDLKTKHGFDTRVQHSRQNDMAIPMSRAMDKCMSLGKCFIKHFDKVYKNPNARECNHWIAEMDAWYKSVTGITLKTTGKPILRGQLRDWFFTAGADPENFMRCATYDELKKYDDFSENILSCMSVRAALKAIKITDSSKGSAGRCCDSAQDSKRRKKIKVIKIVKLRDE